jgi:serine/threonine-protein kinase RsbW
VIAANLVLRLPRDAHSVPLTRRVLDAALASIGVTEDCRADVQLALSEACTNVVRHAERSQNYQVQVGFDEKQCTIEVTDDGPGIDDLTYLDPDEPVQIPSPLGESGRGLRIIALVADEVEVRRRRPTGTLLRFVKRLSWVQDQPPSSSAKPRPK